MVQTIELAKGMEAAQKDTRALKSGTPYLTVGQVSRGSRVPRSRPVPKPADSELQPILPEIVSTEKPPAVSVTNRDTWQGRVVGLVKVSRRLIALRIR